MADAAVKITLETIRDLLVEEAKFLCGVSGEVGDVQKVLQRLQKLLEGADRSKYKDPSVLNDFKEMRQLCYRIEDVVDKYVAEVVLERREKGQEKGIINLVKRIAYSICECKTVHEVGAEIARIKRDISKLTQEMQTYGLIKKALESQKGEKWDEDGGRRTYGLGEEKDFVGKEKDIDLLVAELLNGDASANRVVSIWGMGGLGKTTLAEKIYHHNDIRRGFEAFAWVCVSQVCEPTSVLRDLLGQLNPKFKEAEIKDMGDGKLVREAYKVLKEQKCLIVVDDIWKVADWRCLKPAFPLVAANSKVVITTRNKSVAKLGFFHSLGVLSPDEAWELLQKKAFASTDPNDLGVEIETLEQLGREMVKKCGYLPLAIRVLGGILRDKNSKDAWETVNKDLDLYLRKVDSSEADEEIKQVLSLSYDELPHHLKPCFLSMSQFQENEDIRPEILYLMWIAEGIVSPKDQENDGTLTDVAKRFLGELASRSMVQVEIDETSAREEFESCQLHDLMRDLCLAKSKEEEFVSLMDFRGGKQPSLNGSSLRRLAVYIDEDFNGVSLIGESTQSLRSLFIQGPDIVLTKKVIDFDNLKFLRVLIFEGVDFEGSKLLGEIGKLIHLRMLGFESCSSLELPSCIGDLPFLQILVFWNCDLEEFPSIISKIKRLRYLDLGDVEEVEGKLSLSNLDELETLIGFSSKCCEIMDLYKLPKLRYLVAEIDGNEKLSKFMDWIESNGKRLDYTDVRIINCEFESEQEKAVLSKVCMTCNIQKFGLYNAPIVKLPNEVGFFPSLAVLTVSKCKIREDPMGTLEKLPKLRELVLDYSFEGEEMTCDANGFLQLRRLRVQRLLNLKKWRVEKGALPRLSFLQLTFCLKLGELPDGIRFITTLRELDIGFMPSKFKVRVEKGGEDFDKIRHVNSVKTSIW